MALVVVVVVVVVVDVFFGGMHRLRKIVFKGGGTFAKKSRNSSTFARS